MNSVYSLFVETLDTLVGLAIPLINIVFLGIWKVHDQEK